ncbi:MAG: pantoate--beta-alanine ligase [Chloroflexi bacterium]|nr:MAG: pantoate--beta-alanine ligase [Chloroflexota bacterium]
MKIIRNSIELSKTLLVTSRSIGFIPTMGALHKGHLSLIETSIKECQITVVSIFVNPKQFSPNEDLDKYPRNEKNDIALLNSLAVDFLFIPSFDEIYSDDYTIKIQSESLFKVLEGNARPGHFDGVLAVVCRLLNIVQPNYLYLGKKDAQQLKIIQNMIEDFSLKIIVQGCQIIRDNDGLALSSRNRYLSIKERGLATSIYSALGMSHKYFLLGERKVGKLTNIFVDNLAPGLEKSIDYVSIVNVNDFEQCDDIIVDNSLLLVALFVGDTRLIDNVELKLK